MLPFVGPSYVLSTRQASAQRTVNLFLQGMETAAKAPFILRQCPGITLFSTLGAEVRGCIEADGRIFFVAGDALYEVSSTGVATNRGTLATTSGRVGMAWGTTQLVIVDGDNGYILTLSSNAFAQITDPDFPGSAMVNYLDGFFIMSNPTTQQFYLTSIDDAGTIDALDYASAESAPDDVVAHLVSHRELWLIGSKTTEVWYNASGTDFAFARNNGAAIEIGCVAPWSAAKVDNTIFMIGRDANGSGIVYRFVGYTAQRISTIAVEEALQASTAIEDASAWVYQQNGQTFYCLNAPGMTSTLCYEVSTGTWHDRADLDEMGEFEPFRVTHHVYSTGMHLVGDADGYVYTMSPSVTNYDGDPMVCERTSPNDAIPLRQEKQYPMFVLDCTTGESTTGEHQVELSWSNDGGATFGNPVMRSLGNIGQRFQRLIWRRLGRARDRIWRIRFSGDAPFSIVSGESA